jgi:hypothetical protein
VEAGAQVLPLLGDPGNDFFDDCSDEQQQSDPCQEFAYQGHPRSVILSLVGQPVRSSCGHKSGDYEYGSYSHHEECLVLKSEVGQDHRNSTQCQGNDCHDVVRFGGFSARLRRNPASGVTSWRSENRSGGRRAWSRSRRGQIRSTAMDTGRRLNAHLPTTIRARQHTSWGWQILRGPIEFGILLTAFGTTGGTNISRPV